MKKGRKAYPQLSDRNLKTLRIIFKILYWTLKLAWFYSQNSLQGGKSVYNGFLLPITYRITSESLNPRELHWRQCNFSQRLMKVSQKSVDTYKILMEQYIIMIIAQWRTSTCVILSELSESRNHYWYIRTSFLSTLDYLAK